MIRTPSVTRPLGVGLFLLVGSLVTASCGGNGNPPPAAFIQSTLGPSPDPNVPTMCNMTIPGQAFVGTGTRDNPTPSGGAFDVICTVSQDSATTFKVNAYMQQQGIGSIQISGILSNVPDMPQPNMSGSFVQMDNTYTGAGDCTVTFAVNDPVDGFAKDSEMSVAPGKIYGVLTCPTVQLMNSTSTCYATAEFLFQYCNE